MQTFMPYSDFNKVARCLDNKRLGKQRVEVLQIYKALTEDNYGWKNHPAVKMWKGKEYGLLIYGIIICQEWIKRGFKDTLKAKFEEFCIKNHQSGTNIIFDDEDLPKWVFDKELQLSHQSNLVRKLPEHYKKFFPDVPNNLEYKWVIQ